MELNILFTCAGRRNYLINYFKEALAGQGKIIAADAQHNAAALIDADVAIVVPNIYDETYIDVLKSIIEKHRINAVISLNDLELPILAKNRTDLQKSGVQIIVPDEQVIGITFDKFETANFITSIGLNTPKTYLSLDEVLDALDNKEINFPLVLKPRWGSASIGIEFPENLVELRLSYQLQQLKLKSSILLNASSQDLDHAILFQEKLQGEEYGMDVLNDFNGNYVNSYSRKKLTMRSGETDKAITVSNNLLQSTGKKIAESLRHIGSMDCDLFIDNEKIYVLELNPRFGGGYPFSHEAGANIAAMYIEWLKGTNNIEPFDQFKEGLSFSKCDKMIKIPS